MTPSEEAEYRRRRELREAREAELREMCGWHGDEPGYGVYKRKNMRALNGLVTTKRKGMGDGRRRKGSGR